MILAYNILKYGNSDVTLYHPTTESRTIVAQTKEGVIPNAITATPLIFINGQVTERKTIKVKFAKSLYTKYYTGYELTLPKLSKKQPYQFYRIDFVIDGKTVSRIIGQEWPIEQK